MHVPRRSGGQDAVAGAPNTAGGVEPASSDASHRDEQLLGPADRPADPATLPRRLRAVYGGRVGPTEQSALVSWLAFGVTFGLTRALTHWLRRGHGPAGGGMVIHGRHLHHYNIGIALLATVGAIAVRGEEAHRRHPLTAAAYGTGGALIADELALLIDLEDVYWAKEGRTSVDAAVGAIAVGGAYLAAAPFWHGAAREIARPAAQR